MNIKATLISSLALFCSPFWFASGGASAACTPVVYAFRHAEDPTDKQLEQEPGLSSVDLTPVGRQHADLFLSMIIGFEANFGHNYCPVGFVYSMYDMNPNGTPGTRNPIETAQPLALAACYKYWMALFNNEEISFNGTFNPDSICTGTLSGEPITPSVALRNGHYLYEFLENTAKTTRAKATGSELVEELLSNASVGGGLSSAIFYTGGGLPIIVAAVTSGPNPLILTKGDFKKNSVYVFEKHGSVFELPTDPTQYLQCFNINSANPRSAPGGAKYYCRNVLNNDQQDNGGGNLPDVMRDVESLQGKVCAQPLPPVNAYYGGPC